VNYVFLIHWLKELTSIVGSLPLGVGALKSTNLTVIGIINQFAFNSFLPLRWKDLGIKIKL
jgi:hypothetical protein